MISKKLLAAIAVLLLSGCGTSTAASDKILVADEANDPQCQLPEPFQNQGLIDQVLEINEGDTVEQVTQAITEASDEGYVKFNRPGEFGVMHWTRTEGDADLQVGINFEGRKVSYSSVTLAYEPGTNEEILCYWLAQ